MLSIQSIGGITAATESDRMSFEINNSQNTSTAILKNHVHDVTVKKKKKTSEQRQAPISKNPLYLIIICLFDYPQIKK